MRAGVLAPPLIFSARSTDEDITGLLLGRNRYGGGWTKENGAASGNRLFDGKSSFRHLTELIERNRRLLAGNHCLESSLEFFSVTFVLLGRSEEHTSELQSQFHLVCR